MADRCRSRRVAGACAGRLLRTFSGIPSLCTRWRLSPSRRASATRLASVVLVVADQKPSHLGSCNPCNTLRGDGREVDHKTTSANRNDAPIAVVGTPRERTPHGDHPRCAVGAYGCTCGSRHTPVVPHINPLHAQAADHARAMARVRTVAASCSALSGRDWSRDPPESDGPVVAAAGQD